MMRPKLAFARQVRVGTGRETGLLVFRGRTPTNPSVAGVLRPEAGLTAGRDDSDLTTSRAVMHRWAATRAARETPGGDRVSRAVTGELAQAHPANRGAPRAARLVAAPDSPEHHGRWGQRGRTEHIRVNSRRPRIDPIVSYRARRGQDTLPSDGRRGTRLPLPQSSSGLGSGSPPRKRPAETSSGDATGSGARLPMRHHLRAAAVARP